MAALRVRVQGAVQGVGFRPFCYREAALRGLTGFVLNDLGGVEIVLEGERVAIAEFLKSLRQNPPPASKITGIYTEEINEQGFHSFQIESSQAGASSQSLQVSADLATCRNCKTEILDSADRRYGYEFTNCTDCGPRYTIISKLPYDRPGTTMAEFRMCPRCRAEYEDPGDRRFHAQPNACPVCGPELALLDSKGRVLRCADPLQKAVKILKEGRIVAVKGLGGYHLMCDALNVDAVAELRRRKRRPHKALAVMCADITQARTLADISPQEQEILESTAAPVVLVSWLQSVSKDVRKAVAPANPGVGIMLAYTPLHHLMFASSVDGIKLGPLVATSANIGNQPIISGEEILFAKLGDVFDAAIAHNRPIENRIDDSVVFVKTGRGKRAGIESESGNQTTMDTRPAKAQAWKNIHVIRRARGFAPAPIDTPFPFRPALAVGAETKGSFAVSDGDRMWLSPHIGELNNRETIEYFSQTLNKYLSWFGVKPEIIACDMHPDYLSSRWAEAYSRENNIPLVRIQHHHAHAAAVMSEHQITRPVLALSLDGTGYGPDASIWGCELLKITDRGGRFERLGHLLPLPLIGGEAAIRKPVQMAAGVIAEFFGADQAIRMFGKQGEMAARLLGIYPETNTATAQPEKKSLDNRDQELSSKGLLQGSASRRSASRRSLSRKSVLREVLRVRASSGGRLFDTVAGIMGLVKEITFEAQAPIALEALCSRDFTGIKPYPFEIDSSNLVLDPRPALAEIIADVGKKVDNHLISARFHLGLVRSMLSWAARAGRSEGIKTVVCSGGVFANRTLIELFTNLAGEFGLDICFNQLIPSSDGGLSAGQLHVVSALV